MELGEKIAFCRKKAGLSQEALADRLGLSRQAVSRWETGAAVPDLSKIVELSKLFQVSTDFLLLPEQTEPEHAEPAQPAAPSEQPVQQEIVFERSGLDPVAERQRKFRICFGVAAVVLGLLTAVAALFLTQLYADSLTEWWTSLGKFGTALQSWRGFMLAAGILLLLVGAVVLIREYFRKD